MASKNSPVTGCHRTDGALAQLHLSHDLWCNFPRQVSLGARAVGWRECDINAWLDGLPQKTAAVDTLHRHSQGC